MGEAGDIQSIYLLPICRTASPNPLEICIAIILSNACANHYINLLVSTVINSLATVTSTISGRSMSFFIHYSPNSLYT